MTKKILTGFVLSLLAVTFLSAQSLAELSKKEKERRAALKGKQTVVTNKDLGKTKKKAAMTETAAVESVLPPGAPAEVQPAVAGAVKPAQAAPGEVPPADQAPPEPAAEAGKEASASDQALDRQKTALQDKWNRAQELVDLLTMKMNALWQQLYSMDDVTEKESIQHQISDTYEKLLKAQEESTAAGDELTAFLSREPR